MNAETRPAATDRASQDTYTTSPQEYYNPMQDERPDEDMIRAYLEMLTAHGAPFEIRILNTRRGPQRL
jgi:hypothetical protein